LFDESYYYDLTDIDLGLLLKDPELYKAVNVINEEVYRLLVNNQSLDKINRIDLFVNNKDVNVVN